MGFKALGTVNEDVVRVSWAILFQEKNMIRAKLVKSKHFLQMKLIDLCRSFSFFGRFVMPQQLIWQHGPTGDTAGRVGMRSLFCSMGKLGG